MNPQLKIGQREIGSTAPCFIIAEAGINFNSSIEIAKQLIDAAVKAGCDAIKFQAFTAANLYPKTAGELDWEDQEKKYSYSIYENVKKFELPYSWVPELIRYCQEKEIIFFASICDEEAADVYDKLGVPTFKTTSYAITHLPLIEHLAKKNKPLIISTGGATLEEIKEAYDTARKYNQEMIILHCVIKYPAPLEDVNMNTLDLLHQRFPEAIIGYSDHTIEISEAPTAAIIKGAKVIEKHLTLDKKMSGPDHFFALEPAELKLMVETIRETEKKLMSGEKVSADQLILGSILSEKKISPAEEYLRQFAYQTIITSTEIKAGETISVGNVKVLRPGKLKAGLKPKEYFKLIDGTYKAVKDLSAGTVINWEDVK